MEQPSGFIAHGVRGLQVEEFTLQSEIFSESLVWAFCISDSGVRSLLCREKTLGILADTCEEDPTSCVCR